MCQVQSAQWLWWDSQHSLMPNARKVLWMLSAHQTQQGPNELFMWMYAQSCPTSATPWTVAHQAPLSMGFSRQEYWSGLPFPPSGDLHDPRLEPSSLASPALASRFCITMPPGKPSLCYRNHDLLANIWPVWHRLMPEIKAKSKLWLSAIYPGSSGAPWVSTCMCVNMHTFTYMCTLTCIIFK